ncbi:MAG: hypothetical protein WAV05_01470 [Anaerolineales bacterium]
MISLSKVKKIIHERLARREINLQVRHMAAQVNAQAHSKPEAKPVALFNASTRLVGMSLNGGFSLLTSWALRLQNVPVLHFVCQAGMTRCVLGTDRNDFSKSPPCQACMAQSRWFYSSTDVVPFSYQEDGKLIEALRELTLNQLMGFEYSTTIGSAQDTTPASLPLGVLVLPSIRWVLRRHHLLDDEATRFLYRQYIVSAHRVAHEFASFLDKTNPQAVIVFNGQFFPEATVRWLSLQRGIRTITHEVGLQPFSAFFTTGEATAYPLHVPDDFELNPEQDKRLDAYLSQRFQGQFSMAGVRFWPEMQGLNEDFIRKTAGFKQIVPVFTNVIFDTSQPHSNVVFPHMFAWLDMVLQIILEHPETLFVIRAHPDESRPGKASQESVSQWVSQKDVGSIPNLIFVDSHQSLSSYELIQRSKFVMVYNSTIGLEASILGVPVLCAGRARFTQLPTVFFPGTAQEYHDQAEAFLETPHISLPAEFKRNARRFLYYQLFRSSLPFGDYLEEDEIWPGFVRLKDFGPQALLPSTSPAIKTILEGILENGDFLLESDL